RRDGNRSFGRCLRSIRLFVDGPRALSPIPRGPEPQDHRPVSYLACRVRWADPLRDDGGRQLRSFRRSGGWGWRRGVDKFQAVALASDGGVGGACSCIDPAVGLGSVVAGVDRYARPERALERRLSVRDSVV